MDYGDVALAMGAAAKAEMAWPEKVRKRIVEEFLFDDDDGMQAEQSFQLTLKCGGPIRNVVCRIHL